MNTMKKPELLCPAGNPEKLSAALRFGADAVYLAERASECALPPTISRSVK